MIKRVILTAILSLLLQTFAIGPSAYAGSVQSQCHSIYLQLPIASNNDEETKKLTELLSALSALNGNTPKPEIISDQISIMRKIKITLAKAYNKTVVLSNAFWVWRGLQTYEYGFGDKFTTAINEFKSGDHWIDIGSGSAKALLEFLKQKNDPQIQTTAISVTKPASYFILKKLFSNKQPELLQKHRYLSGQTIEELNPKAVGLARADLITDMFGAFSYSPHIDQVLTKEISLLKIGGKLFVYTPLIWQIKIFNSAGQKIALHDWLNSLQGVKVHSLLADKVNDEMSVINGFIIERTDEEINVPKLKLINMSSEIVSERTYISH